MPQRKKQYCIPMKKNLENCLKKQENQQTNKKCDYLRKILNICITRDKPMYHSGP